MVLPKCLSQITRDGGGKHCRGVGSVPLCLLSPVGSGGRWQQSPWLCLRDGGHPGVRQCLEISPGPSPSRSGQVGRVWHQPRSSAGSLGCRDVSRPGPQHWVLWRSFPMTAEGLHVLQPTQAKAHPDSPGAMVSYEKDANLSCK